MMNDRMNRVERSIRGSGVYMGPRMFLSIRSEGDK